MYIYAYKVYHFLPSSFSLMLALFRSLPLFTYMYIPPSLPPSLSCLLSCSLTLSPFTCSLILSPFI